MGNLKYRGLTINPFRAEKSREASFSESCKGLNSHVIYRLYLSGLSRQARLLVEVIWVIVKIVKKKGVTCDIVLKNCSETHYF